MQVLDTGLRRASGQDAEHYNRDDQLGAVVNDAVLVSATVYGMPDGLAALAKWRAGQAEVRGVVGAGWPRRFAARCA